MKAKAKRAPAAKIQYLTDGRKPVAVVLKLPAYRALLERMEDLEDSLDIQEAKRKSTGFISLEQLKQEIAAMRKR